jgi:N-acetylneuraminic acid mutarotase
MPGPRTNAGVAAVNGILYVIGGSSFNINSVSTVFAYDPVAGTWSTRSPMPTARNGLATAVVNGIIYAIGGRDFRANTGQFGTLSEVYAYNPATDTWSGPLAPMPHPSKVMSVAVIDGLIYVAGGIGEGIAQANIDAYDPVQNVWIPKTPLAAGRGLTAGGVVNGVFYILGGFPAGSSLFVATNEAFIP